METELLISLETRAGRAPEWLRLLPLGEVTLGDQREPFTVDREALAAMVQHYRERGLDLVIDYEHQTLAGGKAPAAGWIKELEAREDGLWVRVEWTEAARSHLEAREYRYFSPVLRLAKTGRRPVALLHAALTNTPAINHLPPLVAKESGLKSRSQGLEVSVGCALRTGDKPETDVPKDHRQDQALRLEISEQKEGQVEKLLEQLKDRLGLKPEATAAEVVALADQRLSAAAAFAEAAGLLGLPENAGAAQVKGAILALHSSLENLGRAQEELAALKSEQDERRVREAVDEALKAGKIQPSQQESALKYAQTDPEGFRTFVEKSLPVLPLGEIALSDAAPAEGNPASSEMAVCEALGITPEAFKVQEKQLRLERLL